MTTTEPTETRPGPAHEQGAEVRIEFDVPATMRDGTVLRANVFRPAAGGPFPVALMRTPYRKDFATVTPSLDATRLARAGYIVVVQDVRGRWTSGGEWDAFVHEREDGADAVDWAAALPGSDGTVGMFGSSYFAFTQLAAAAETSGTHLKAMVPSMTWADGADGVFWRGGAFELGLFLWWYIVSIAPGDVLRRHAQDPPMERMQSIRAWVGVANSLPEIYRTRPLQEVNAFEVLGAEAGWQELLASSGQSEQIDAMSPSRWYDEIHVPGLFVGGWYDFALGGTLQNFVALRSSDGPGKDSRLVVGPWSHFETTNVVGDVDFGVHTNLQVNAQIELTDQTRRWFDHHLQGAANGVEDDAPVRLFVMGVDQWRDEQEWPLARTEYRETYFHEGGVLDDRVPGEEEPTQFAYDPLDPTPTLGGNLLLSAAYGPGPRDQRTIEERPDVVSFTSRPLEADMEVTGPVRAHVWVASDSPDTDFVVRLVDVSPDGYARNLCDGIARCSARPGGSGRPLEPGEPVELDVDLWATSNVFLAGHAIRVDIASASFPRWDPNPNTGARLGADGQTRVALQSVLHDRSHASHILLPVIPTK